jgi:hypothetical protein
MSSKGKMLGRIAWSLHNHPGEPCGECGSGWPIGARAQKRRESRDVDREIADELRPEPVGESR